MFYNVIVTDEFEQEFYNQLVFSFYKLDEALKFVEEILLISNYSIKILKLEDGDK